MYTSIFLKPTFNFTSKNLSDQTFLHMPCSQIFGALKSSLYTMPEWTKRGKKWERKLQVGILEKTNSRPINLKVYLAITALRMKELNDRISFGNGSRLVIEKEEQQEDKHFPSGKDSRKDSAPVWKSLKFWSSDHRGNDMYAQRIDFNISMLPGILPYRSLLMQSISGRQENHSYKTQVHLLQEFQHRIKCLLQTLFTIYKQNIIT